MGYLSGLALYLVLFFLFLFAIALLIITVTDNEVFPNVALTWSLRIVSLLIILGALGLYRRGRLKNL